LKAMQSVTIVVFLCALSIAFGSPIAEFKQFMKTYGKQYADAREFKSRLSIFQDNLKIIEELNARNTSATFGITQFADITTQEFKAKYLSPVDMRTMRNPEWPVADSISKQQINALPDSWDWRTKNAVTPVKNQGQCGSCWAFSTTGSVEGQWAIKTGKLVGLSEQNLVDCDHHCMIYQGQQSCDAGCNGGLMPNAFQYIIGNGGIDSEDSYPYEAFTGESCQFNASSVAAKISNWTMIQSNEDQMAAYMVANGPISIAVDATEWQFYMFGIFESPFCGEQLDHGVLIVGYDHEVDWFGQDTQYWWVKNSWGTSFGYSGYIKLEKGSDQCGDNLFPCSAIA